MTIQTSGKTIEYSVTAGGQYTETTSFEGKKIIRTTPYVRVFLQRIMRSEVETELNKQNQQRREFQLMKMITWWELPTEDFNYGSFNTDHYNKVIQARKK